MPKRCKKCRVPLEEFKRKKLRALFAEGYAEMVGEVIKITREFEELDNEALKYEEVPE